MANLVVDGFDWFPSGLSSSERDRLWAANNFFASTGLSPQTADVETGRFGFGKAMLFNDATFGGSMGYVVPVGANVATGFIGFAMFIYPDTASNGGAVAEFYDGVSDVAQTAIQFAANGVIKVYSGDISGTLLGTSTPGAFQENEWFHCEMKATIANSGGAVEVRINTVPMVQLASVDTQNSAAAYFDCIAIRGFKSSTTNFHFSVDDLFVNDTTGSSNNTWAGNLRVKTQFMIANGATDNFTIGGTSPAATQWQSVLNQNLDDVKFVYSPNVGDIDLFTPDPNLNAPLVRSVQIRMALRQDDATQRTARAMLRIGGVNYLGSVDQATNQTYTFYKERWQLSPATGVTFTGSEVNGLQAGLKVQA